MRGAELIELASVGSSLIVGTVSIDGEPRATRAWSVQLREDDSRVRVIMGADDGVSVDNLRTGGIALTCTGVLTLRSVQLKGRVVRTEPVNDADVQLMAEHTTAFMRAVQQFDDFPLERLERVLPGKVIAVEFDLEAMFDQSPGPDAGASVAR